MVIDMQFINTYDTDFKEHNSEIEKVWDSYRKGTPIRMPMITGISDRFFVMNKTTNPKNISFYDYSNDPKLMFDMQCEFSKYAKFNIIGDHQMGIPQEGWTVNVDFQNYYEAAWYGCNVEYPDNEVPFAVPMLNDDNKNILFEKGIPDPFGGFMAKAKEYYDIFKELSVKKLILGQKINNIGAWFTGTDGMFTIACELRGADNICIDMYEDPDFYHQLMDYLTESVIMRMKAWRKYMGVDIISKEFWFADDSILLLSTDMYKEFVLPYHKKLAQALSTMENRGGVHLCGDATRHFKTIRDELNVYTFDTGFPVDHKSLCLELGDEVTIQGGPSAQLVQCGTINEIDAESKRIIELVKPISKKFIFRDGNDIPPYTPLENIQALYDACKKYGQY